MTARRPGLTAVVGAVAAALLLAGCSDQDAQEAQDAVDRAGREVREQAQRAEEELDRVDWDRYGRQAKRRLDRLAEQADCRGLQRALTRAEPDDAALTRYIKQRLRQADCPGA